MTNNPKPCAWCGEPAKRLVIVAEQSTMTGRVQPKKVTAPACVDCAQRVRQRYGAEARAAPGGVVAHTGEITEEMRAANREGRA